MSNPGGNWEATKLGLWPAPLAWSTTKILLGPLWTDQTPTMPLKMNMQMIHMHRLSLRHKGHRGEISSLKCLSYEKADLQSFLSSKVWVSGTNVVSAFLPLLSNVFTSLTLEVTAQKQQGRVFHPMCEFGVPSCGRTALAALVLADHSTYALLLY